MATNTTPFNPDDMFAPSSDEKELDQAIDDLRGVLKADETGALGDEFGAAASQSPFGADLASDTSFGGSDFGGSDFGGSDFGGASLGSDFGSSASSSMAEPGSALNSNLDMIMDIPITVEIVLGTSKMQVSGLMGLEEGAIIALDKKIGEPVEITVNGRRIARGEITVLENDDTRFGVKLTEVLSTTKV